MVALSRKHGESSTPVMDKIASEEIDENMCCTVSVGIVRQEEL